MSTTGSTTTDTAGSKPTDNQSDTGSISSVIQAYVEGGRKGDASIMNPAFREDATIHGYIGGDLLAGPIQILFDWVAESPPATDLEATIASIDIVETVATARVEIIDWLGHRFTDQFTLLKEDGAWRITSKVFHTH
jgi:hypothetical protein